MSQPTVNYLSRDFLNIKNDLINWAKTYHSDKLVFFNDANTDIMYLEMVAYVGDMLSYYTDKTFNENFRTTAQALESLVRISNNLGFYNTGAMSSIVEVEVSVKIPFTSSTIGAISPDYKFCPILSTGTKLKSDSGVSFEITEAVNFTLSQNRTETPNYDGNGAVIDYTITKKVTAKAGETRIQSFYVSEALYKPFLSFVLNDLDITEIVGLVVVQGKQTVAPTDYSFVNYNVAYYQVRELTQSKAFFETNIDNTSSTALIKQGAYQPIPRRFIVRRDAKNTTTITFGNQYNEDVTEKLYSPVTADEYFNNVHDDVDLGTLPPVNSTIFVKYRIKGGSSTNVVSGTINSITAKQWEAVDLSLPMPLINKIRSSLKVTNPLDASGGRDTPTLEELREISGKTFAAQDRGVTSEDIKTMVKLMPPKFGNPFRVSYDVIGPRVANSKTIEIDILALTDKLINSTIQSERILISSQIKDYFKNYNTNAVKNNMLVADPNLWLGEKGLLYIIGQTEDGQLNTIQKNASGAWVSPNQILKENIKNFLIDKRVIGDWIDILDGKIYNLQVEFTIFADSNNKQQTLIDCLQKLVAYFDVNNWQMGQPIYISNVSTILQEISGVISVADLKFYNIIGTGVDSVDPVSGRKYQPLEIGLYPEINPTYLNSYGSKFEVLANNNIIKGYPNSIFEVKYPESDIIGKLYS